MQRIAIIGLGYIGCSIGLRLKHWKRNRPEIVGFDIEQKSQKNAEKIGAIDSGVWGLPDAVRESDLIVLSIPTGAVKDVFVQTAQHLKPGATITDTSTSMRRVLTWANELLPKGSGFVGGNPMVSGNDVSEATENAFGETRWAISTTPQTPSSSVSSVVDLIDRMGAKPFFIDAEEHDSYVAAAAHIPIVISNALMLSAARSPTWDEISRFAGQDFKKVSSCTQTNPEISSGSLKANQDMITSWIDRVILELNEFKELLSRPDGMDDNDSDPLATTLNDAWEARLRWDAGIRRTEIERPDMPNSGDSMMSMLMGDHLARRLKQMTRQTDR